MAIAAILSAAGAALFAAGGVHIAAAPMMHAAFAPHGALNRSHAAAPGVAGFGEERRQPFGSAGQGWGYGGWRGEGGRRHDRGDQYGSAYPYWGYGFDGGVLDTDYPTGYGPGDNGAGPPGPPPPFGPFGPGYPPMRRPLARAPAPLVYGPGPHDDAYAYGFNGHSQTPSLIAYDP